MKKLLLIGSIVLGGIIILGGTGFLAWKYGLGYQKIFDAKARGSVIGATIQADGESKNLTETGGDIGLTTQSGSALKLALPEKALQSPDKISLREIDSLDGLPQSMSFVSGVEVGPDGTWLDKPAILTLDIPSDKTDKTLVGFSFSKDGKDFQFYPLKIDGNIATMQLTGFSGYGILELRQEDAAPAPPTSIEKQAKQHIAKIVSEGKGSHGVDQNQTRRIKNILTAWYKTSVKINLSEAANSPDKIDAALHEFLSWKSTGEFFGLDDGFKNEIEKSYDDIALAVKNASNKSFDACTKDKDPQQAAKLMRYKKIIELLPIEGRSGLREADLDTKIKKCVNFKLTIASKIVTTSSDFTNTVEASGEGTIIAKDSGTLSGNAQVTTISDQTAGLPACYSNSPEVWKIDIPDFSLATSAAGPKLSLQYDLTPPDGIVWTCPMTYENWATTSANNSWIFDVLHQKEMISLNQDKQNFTLVSPGWEIVGKGGVFAKKVYVQDQPDPLGAANFHEETTFELIHTPQN